MRPSRSAPYRLRVYGANGLVEADGTSLGVEPPGPFYAVDRHGARLDDVGDPLDVVEMQQWYGSPFEGNVRGDRDYRGISWVKRWFRFSCAIDLDLRMTLTFETFDQHQVDGLHPPEQRPQPRFGFVAQLMHQRPSQGRCDQHLLGASLAVLPGVFARLVNVEAVMSMLQSRNR